MFGIQFLHTAKRDLVAVLELAEIRLLDFDLFHRLEMLDRLQHRFKVPCLWKGLARDLSDARLTHLLLLDQ